MCTVRFFTYVSVLRTVLKVFCLIVRQVSTLRIVLNVLCTIFCYVSVLRAVLKVLRWIVCFVSALRTVLYVFSLLFVTFEFCALFIIVASHGIE